MTLFEKITSDWKEALRDKNQPKKVLLSTVRSEIKNKEIEKRKELTDDEVMAVLSKMVKQRNESISLVAKANPDAADRDMWEIKVLEGYLPEMLSPEEVEEIVNMLLRDSPFTKSDFGKAMGVCMSKLKGRADGKVIQSKVKKYLEDK